MAITLYSLCGEDRACRFSPHVWKVVMALRLKGLAFEEVPCRFSEIAGIEGGMSKTVPVLRDGDQVVADSFAIAVALEERYPDRPSLFGGPGGQAAARLIESWSQNQIHAAITAIAVKRIHDRLDAASQPTFRATREARIGMTLEAAEAAAPAARAGFAARLEPLRLMLKHQPFIGGATPLFGDCIVFGALQWLKIVDGHAMLAEDDPVRDWFGRCLALAEGAGPG